MGSSVRPDSAGNVSLGGTPLLHRILSPDEFQQAQQLGPDALTKNPFPLLPPAAPKDAVKRLDPNSGAPDNSVPEQLGAAARNSSVGRSPGLAGILTRQVAAPILEHPFLTAAGAVATAAVPALGTVWTGLMGKDLLEYSAQKAAELSLDPETRKLAEADPTRISGEQAGVEAAMLGAAPLVHAIPKVGEALGAAARGADESLSGGSAQDLAVAQAGGNERFAGVGLPAAQRAAIKGHVDAVTDSWKQIFAPDTRSPQAAEAAGILRASTGQAAGAYEQAAFKLDEFRRAIDPLPETDKLGFIDAIEGGRSQVSPEFQSAADIIRTTLDNAREQIRALGTGKLEHFIEDYFPHIWTDPDAAATAFKPGDALADAAPGTGGRAPLEGSKSFLKKRSIPTTFEGIQAGLTPVSMNPVDLTLLKLREMQRYLVAHQSLNEMKNAGLVSYVRAGEQAPDGYARINDKIATVFGKPSVTVTEAFDAQQRAGLEQAIKDLGGVSLERKTALGGKGQMAGSLGLAYGDSKIVAKFGTHDGVIMHELGHILDARYGLQAKFAQVDGAADELAALADLRAESNPAVDPMYRAYLQKPEEQVANALHAYLHAPETMQEVAPKTMEALDAFLASKPELAPIRDIKPSLELGTGTNEVPVGGMVIRGEHWAPEPVARVVNNYLSPGLRGNAIYDAYRGIGNSLNQAQLGLSAFHLGFTSLDASVSRAALGLEHLASGNVLQAADAFATTPAAPISNAIFGAKIRSAYLNPESASPEMQALANAVKEAGGRVRMDSFYKNSAAEKMVANWREGGAIGVGKAAAYSLPALFEASMKPLMEHVVPMQKLGVFGDMAKKILADLPEDATLAERRAALGNAWDSVDNRMGQLVYDNLFWNKVVKDLSMASVRSVGWNLGTIREVGGGLADVAAIPGKVQAGADLSSAITHKAAYVAALPITVGLYGAVYQYLRTGELPADGKDLYFPRTGEVDVDGNAERVQLPSYMKDVFAYGGDPWSTVKHKMAPVLSAIGEMLNNEDFYGDEIRNPQDPMVAQLKQEAAYIATTAIPFSFRSMGEQTKRGDQSDVTKFGSWVGVTPAPRAKVRSDAQNLMAEDLKGKTPSGATPEEVEHRAARADLLRAFRGVGTIDTDKLDHLLESGKLVPADIGRELKRAGMTPAQEKFKSLTLAQAVKVFEAGTDDEKAKFAAALMKKVERASTAVATTGTP